MNKRLLVVFLLGFSSGMPLALLGSTLQAWFSDKGMPVLATGMLSLIGLPYIYRALWGPLLDRYSLFFLGKRRSWILMMQILLLIGFNIMAWCSPQSSPHLIISIAFILACFSATQDIAIDSHRTEYLPIQEHGLGASFASFGYRLALLMAGGIALIIAQHVSWKAAYQLMALCMLPGMFAVLCSHEPSLPNANQFGMVATFVEPIKELFSRPGIITLLFFIFFYKLGESFTTITSGIVMPFLIQGLGFSLDTIAYVYKILGISSVLVGGLFAGWILLRYSLPKSLLCFGLVQAASNGLFVLLAYSGNNITYLAIAVICDNFAAGLGSTAILVLFMRLVDKRFTATQLSLLVAFSSIPRVISGPMSAYLQLHIGWSGLYILSVLLAFAFVPFLFKMNSSRLKLIGFAHHTEMNYIN